MGLDDPSHPPRIESDLTTPSASVPILAYAPATDDALQVGWGIAIALTLFQVFWIVGFLYPPLGWDQPKRLGKDSLYFLLQAAPSLASGHQPPSPATQRHADWTSCADDRLSLPLAGPCELGGLHVGFQFASRSARTLVSALSFLLAPAVSASSLHCCFAINFRVDQAGHVQLFSSVSGRPPCGEQCTFGIDRRLPAGVFIERVPLFRVPLRSPMQSSPSPACRTAALGRTCGLEVLQPTPGIVADGIEQPGGQW